MKKTLLILVFAGLNVLFLQNCADDNDDLEGDNDTGSSREFLDNDANDPDRSLDDDGDTFQDSDLNDRDGSLDSDDDQGADNDLTDPDRGLDADNSTDADASGSS